MRTTEKKFVFDQVLCSLRNMNLVFGTKVIFHDANCLINTGDHIGLLGLNGQGKSTLFKVITGEIIPNHSEKPFIFDKYQGGGDQSKAFSVFLVPQDLPMKNDEKLLVKDVFFIFYPELKEPMEKMEYEKIELMGGFELLQAYESYLRFWGLNDFEAKVSTLSGGEQKRILLALGLSSKANLILWDEPTNHLDVETIKRFEEELMNVTNTYMLVTHDRYLLSKVTNKILQLKDGLIEQFDGNYAEYLDFLKEKEIHRQKVLDKLKNTMRRETDWISRGVRARRTKSKKRIEDYGTLSGQIQKLKEQSKKELDFLIASSKRKTKKLIEAIDVTFSYGERTLFENISLTLHRGDKIGIIGPNGCGKTTLVKLLMGYLNPKEGEIKQAEQLKIQYFSQDRSSLSDEITPYQLLGDGQDMIHLPDGRTQHVISYFESFLFRRDDIHRPLKYFSGGERGRLQMALNLKQAGDVWIFDEPTNDLDLETLQILETKLEQFDGVLLLISHDRSFLETVTNRVWVIEEDKKMTFFEAGYAHAAPYLEALALENELKKELKKEETSDNPSSKAESFETSNKKLSNKEKLRLKELPLEIKKLEEELLKIESLLETYDFSQMDKDKATSYQKLSEEKEKIEMNLLKCYEEWDSFENS